jgi:hypothetical protein
MTQNILPYYPIYIYSTPLTHGTLIGEWISEYSFEGFVRNFY